MPTMSIPNANTPLADWLIYLQNAHHKTIDLAENQLMQVKAAANAMDLLKPASFVITVGGTNGKGSTCRFLEMLCLKAGLRVGVYSSPHLLDYRERVRINSTLLPEQEHCQSFDFIEKNKTISLSYFEFSTLSALNLFKEHRLDVVILEVGLGGRLDATNIVDSQVAVIASIDIDHTAFLGNTREAIAFEKAGILRANCPAVIGEPNPPQTLIDVAKTLHCNLSQRGVDWSFEENSHSWSWQSAQGERYEDLPIPAIPVANAALGLAVLDYLPFNLTFEQIRQVLSQVSLTGRFQTISPHWQQRLAQRLNHPMETLPRVILDVGHNPHAACYLAEKIQQEKNAGRLGKLTALCGVLADKDLNGILNALTEPPIIDEWYALTLTGDRGQQGKIIQQVLAERHIQAAAFDDIAHAIAQITAELTPQDSLLIFGSFHTVGAFIEWLGVDATP